MRTEKEKSVSRGWVVHFVSRHPQFKLKKGRLLDNLRCSACTRKNLAPWFSVYTELMQSPTYDDRLIFNIDETSVNILDQCHSKLLERSDTTTVPIIPKAERYASTTLVISIASYGNPLTSILIWPQATVPKELVNLKGFNIAIIANSSGWQTKATFEQMMLEVSLPQLVQRRKDLNLSDKQIMLIIDGHHSRLSLLFIYACLRWHITVLVIPAHTSSEIQPNDCGINGAFKAAFTKECARRTTIRHKESEVEQAPSEQQIVVPQSFPPHKRYPSGRLPKEEILKALNASETEIPLPALFDQYVFDSTTSRSQRQREILVDVIPRALEKALSITTISSSWQTAGLLPIGTGKDTILSKLPEGENQVPQPRSFPVISGRILTSAEVLTEMWEWQLKKNKSINEEEYIQQTLTSIYDAISQTEDQFKLLFGVNTVTRETIDNEVKSQLRAIQELRQRRQDEKRRNSEISQTPKIVAESTSGQTKTELVILGKQFALSELSRIRGMSATEFSHFISSLQASNGSLNCLCSQPEQSTKATIPLKRKKRQRDDFPLIQEKVHHSESSSDESNSGKHYRTRQRRVRQEAEDYYDESEVDILLHEPP